MLADVRSGRVFRVGARVVVVLSLLVVAIGCVSESDGGDSVGVHACFVQCADDSYYCGEGPATQKACNERAVEVCAGSSVVNSTKIDDCTCDDAACTPDWFSPM